VKFLFYISGHGFGHASRQVEIINELGSMPGHRILIRSAVSSSLLERTVRVPYQLIPGECDTGIVQSTSIDHDDNATVEAALAFYSTFEDRIDAEVEQVQGEHVDLVIGDIPPLAFQVATRLGRPSVALANFTWDWIYETHPGFLPRGASVLEVIRSSYRQATRALALPFAAGFEVFRDAATLPMIARRPTQTPAATRSHFDLPADGKVALLSFGGYGMPSLDLGRVDCRRDWTIVTTDRTSAESPAADAHVRRLAEHDAFGQGIRYEDLVAAADVVITKPGYGILAECIAGETAVLYTSRGHFREYAVLVDAMPRFLRCRFISQEALFRGEWRDALDGLLDQPEPPERMPLNGAEVAAGFLQRF
jgi:hypothetical protein